jgi:hypothetical protein
VGNTGEDGPAALWRTTDGGENWTELTDRKFLELGKIFGIPVQAAVWTVDFVDREIGFAGGTWETLFGYTASHRTWQPARQVRATAKRNPLATL